MKEGRTGWGRGRRRRSSSKIMKMKDKWEKLTERREHRMDTERGEGWR